MAEQLNNNEVQTKLKTLQETLAGLIDVRDPEDLMMIDHYTFYSTEPPKWFVHTPISKKPTDLLVFQDLFGRGSSYKHASIVGHFYDLEYNTFTFNENADWPAPPLDIQEQVKKDIADWIINKDADEDAVAVWNLNDEMFRLTQWRFFYAASMLQARNKYIYQNEKEDLIDENRH